MDVKISKVAGPCLSHVPRLYAINNGRRVKGPVLHDISIDAADSIEEAKDFKDKIKIYIKHYLDRPLLDDPTYTDEQRKAEHRRAWDNFGRDWVVNTTYEQHCNRFGGPYTVAAEEEYEYNARRHHVLRVEDFIAAWEVDSTLNLEIIYV